MMQTLGPVDKSVPLNPGLQRNLRLPPSVMITYKHFDARRDPVRVSCQLYTVPYLSVLIPREDFPPAQTLSCPSLRTEGWRRCQCHGQKKYAGPPTVPGDNRTRSAIVVCWKSATCSFSSRLEGIRGRRWRSPQCGDAQENRSISRL
jgi:hypothetical protein